MERAERGEKGSLRLLYVSAPQVFEAVILLWCVVCCRTAGDGGGEEWRVL